MTLIAVVYCRRSTAEVRAYVVVWDVVWLSWVFLQRVAWSGRPAEIAAQYPSTWLALLSNIAFCCCNIRACSLLMCFAPCSSSTRKFSVNVGSSTDCLDLLPGPEFELLDKFLTLEGG